ncbi:MAG TPA: hypothetical protein VKA46_08280 [Gemmataceae bacterium]|nr:hypothetical protein [Gemmataceae bacterium]
MAFRLVGGWLHSVTSATSRWGNRHRKPVLDTRTPEELLDLIEAKGREIAAAIALLRRTETAT